MEKNRVLILCTGNSCRSQIAEAVVNHFLGEQWQAFSAGIKPAAAVHPMTFQVLEEIGIRHQGVPKSVDLYRGQDFDLVITVCGEASESCPVWLEKGRRVHIGFPDPAKAEGSEEDKLRVFRQVRDAIREQIPAYLRSFSLHQA